VIFKISVAPLVILSVLLLTACGPSAARYNNRGNDQFEDGDYDEAMNNYRLAQQENPDLAAPYYNSGNTYHRQGNLESAATQLKQSNRTAAGKLAQNSNYNLGNTYFEAQDWEHAIEAYKESLRINPDDQDAKYNLELALKKLEEQQQQQQGGGGGSPPPPDDSQPQDGGGQDQQDQQNQGQNGEQKQPGSGQPEQDDSGQSGQGQQDQSGGGSRGLTPQEAEQLLDALGQDSQTLQERLQEGFFAPGLPPDKDW